MNKSSLMFAAALTLLTGSALAQGALTGIAESTDPAKAAAVEQHAAELRAHSQAKPAVHHVRHRVRHDTSRAKKPHATKSSPTQAVNHAATPAAK